MSNFRTLQSANKRKTFLLLAVMGALVWVVVFAALTYAGQSTAGIVPIAGFSADFSVGFLLRIRFTSSAHDRCAPNS